MNWITDIFKNRPASGGGYKPGSGTFRGKRDAASEGAAYVNSGAAFHEANMASVVVVLPTQPLPAQPAATPSSCPFEFVDSLVKGGSRE